jgi:NAD(P)-dependent dehydrogenase (short-subunit alcohol dehydrogenase family)
MRAPLGKIDEQFDLHFDANVKGLFFCGKAVLL